MAHVVKLRVKDTTASTGTGAKVLARSTLLNFRTFDSVMVNGDTCDAIVVNRSANQWEHSLWEIAGVGSEPVLTRREFKESSTGTPVAFSEGTKDVLMLYPVAGKLDFTARTLKLAPNIIDGTPGTASTFRFYDDGNGWIAGLGISSGAVDIRSGWNLNFWSGQTGNQRNTVRINQNGLSVAVGTAVAAGIEPAAALHVVNHAGAPSAIITTSTNTAVRIGPYGSAASIEGVDYTGLNAYRSLLINGEELLFATGGLERLRVKWDGSVAIGTTVAGAKFHVQGAGFNGGNGYFVSTDSANSVAIKGANGAAIFDSAYVALMDGTRAVYLGLSGTAAGGDVGRFRIIGANGQENFSIGTTGNVALGPISAAAKLSIGLDGTGDPNNYGRAIQITRGPSGGQQIAFIRSGAQVVSLGYLPGSNAFGFGLGRTTDASFWPNYLAIGGDGNIGINTAAPNARLSFGTNIGLNGIYLYDDGNAGATGFGISPNTLNIFANALSTTSATIAFGKYDKTTFTEWARITDGKLAVGTTSQHFVVTAKSGNDAVGAFLAAGVSKGIRVVTSPTYAAVEAVDHTGVVSFQPLAIKGSDIRVGSLSADRLFVSDNGVGISGWAESGYNLDIYGSRLRLKNWGTSGASSEFYQAVSERYVYRGVNYDGRYLHEYGSYIETRYSDFANHIWRGVDGVDRMILNGSGLGIGRTPGMPLDVMMAGHMTAGYQPVANFGVYNAAAGAAFTRMYVGQASTNVMFLEVANKDNAKGDMILQPFGGYVIVGNRLFSGVDIGQLSMQVDYNGPLTFGMYNHNGGVGASCKFSMIIGARRVERLVYHNGRWVQEKGYDIDQFYTEFDTHFWRTNAGADKMILHSNKVIWLGNTGGDPVTPSGGGYLYIVGGALKYRGSGGTITTLAPA